jgi:hypothetical protein
LEQVDELQHNKEQHDAQADGEIDPSAAHISVGRATRLASMEI